MVALGSKDLMQTFLQTRCLGLLNVMNVVCLGATNNIFFIFI